MSTHRKALIPPKYFEERRKAHVIRSEQEALDAAAQYAEYVARDASDRDRNWALPFEEITKLAESGLFGITVPRSHGGLGISTAALTEVFKRISAADSAIGQIPQNHHQFVLAIDLSGTDEQKSYYFREILEGRQLGNALSERGTKTVLDLHTRVKAVGEDRFVLNGRKHYSTGALFAPHIPVFALDDSGRLIIAYVKHGAEGVTILNDWSGIGQRATASGTVIFENVALSSSNVFPHWRIYEGPQLFGAFGQIMHVAIDVGIAQAALADAVRFVHERSRPWFESDVAHVYEEPYIIRRFGELGLKLRSAEALLERAARIYDEALMAPLTAESANDVSLAVAVAKVAATEAAVDISNALFEVAGTASMDAQYNLDRHWRNARIHTLHDPARWKLHHIGNYFLNGKLLPNNPIN
jgi:SfnB family sulfur acquisition oxidoreductase